MSTSWQTLRETLFRALIPGAVLPVIFYLLYSANSHTTARDILPDLPSPLATISFLGLIATCFPGFIAMALITSIWGTFRQVIAPYLLPSQMLLIIQIVASLAINTALWMVPVVILRRIKQFFSAPEEHDTS